MITVECNYLEPHTHEYPDDWKFGGANNKHPGADPRYKVSNYEYYDDKANVVWVTSSPTCDEQAMDEFTWVAQRLNCNPVWISVRRADGSLEMLPVVYDKKTDTVFDK